MLVLAFELMPITASYGRGASVGDAVQASDYSTFQLQVITWTACCTYFSCYVRLGEGRLGVTFPKDVPWVFSPTGSSAES